MAVLKSRNTPRTGVMDRDLQLIRFHLPEGHPLQEAGGSLGLGFWVLGFEFRVLGIEFGIVGLEFGVSGLGILIFD